ncbi:MAG: hypothetical protein Kapaf2KO_22920 [Candidatus Kapaibacteriales bacterium]
MKKTLIITSTCLFMGIAILIFRPVPIITEDESISESGKVVSVFECGTNDITIIFENNKRRFYINRGIEEGLSIYDLKERLVGNIATVKYPDYWTPLDWNGNIKHISKLEYNDITIFDEFKK